MPNYSKWFVFVGAGFGVLTWLLPDPTSLSDLPPWKVVSLSISLMVMVLGVLGFAFEYFENRAASKNESVTSQQRVEVTERHATQLSRTPTDTVISIPGFLALTAPTPKPSLPIPSGPSGTWVGNRFVYDSPQPVLTKAVRSENDGKFFRFPVPNVLPNSFVQFKVEYDGGVARALVVPHENQEVSWQSITRNTHSGVRIADDSTTVLKVHVPQNSDMTVVRVHTLWWERPSGKPPARGLTEAQQKLIAETLKGSDWQPNTLWIRYFSPCEECRKYASDLKAAVTMAGWNGDFGQTLDQREDLLGLKLHVADLNAKPRTADLLAMALDKASVRFDWSPWPEMDKGGTILFAYPVE